MYKIAILGCENSHANSFLNIILKDNLYTDIEVVGVYSCDEEAAKKINEEYGVYVAKSYDEFVGKVDGIVITARHGDNHYKYAKPYLKSGIPMFVDKPITVSIEDAENFKKDLIENNVRVSGGSTLKHPLAIKELKYAVENSTYGKTYGGHFRAPINMENEYGNFYFYSQHLIQMVCEVFGYFPCSAIAFKNNEKINCTLRYENCDVNLLYVDGNFKYMGQISCEKGAVLKDVSLDGCSEKEFAEFYNILSGGSMTQTYDEFFAPVYIMNAIDASLQSGKEEKIERG